MERLESVAVTHIPVDGGDPLYRVVSQVSDVGVVRPVDPSAVAELMTFRRGPTGTVDDVRIVTPSSLSPGGAPLYSAAETQTLGMLLYALQDHFAANVYPDITPLRLDVEVEVRPDGTLILKQARPYLGTEP
jgi:hypothetical protein